MIIKILTIFALSFLTVTAEVIKLDNFEEYDLRFDNRPCLGDDLKDSEKINKKELEFGKINKQIGPVSTEASYNPLSKQSQIEAQLDLIDSYRYFKTNHDPRKIIPYAVKNIRKGASDIKHIKSNTKKKADEYKELLEKEFTNSN